jgi:phage tail protein X
MTETVVVTGREITLDLLLWRRFGVRGETLVEATLDLNPGLAPAVHIPPGTAVVLPDAPAAPATAETAVDLFS